MVKKKVARKKTIKRRPAKKRTLKRPLKRAKVRAKAKAKARKPSGKKTAAKLKGVIGVVTHYFPKVRAAVVKMKAPLAIGDVIKIKGHTTDFTQAVTSMQIDLVPITTAKKGDEIGLLVDSRVRSNDVVCKA